MVLRLKRKKTHGNLEEKKRQNKTDKKTDIEHERHDIWKERKKCRPADRHNERQMHGMTERRADRQKGKKNRL